MDGTDFHHRSRDNNQMCAHGPMAAARFHLRGSGFKIANVGYGVFPFRHRANQGIPFLPQYDALSEPEALRGHKRGSHGKVAR